MKSFVCHIVLLLLLVVMTSQNCRAQYYTSNLAPDPTVFLPLPFSDDNNPHWAYDIYRHYQYKSYRDSAYMTDIKYATYDYRSNNESSLQTYYSNNHVKFFQSAFGLLVDKSTNKDLFLFLDSCRITSNLAVKKIPDSWYRLRPCVRLREANFGAFRPSSSYAHDYASSPSNSFPSPEASFGWLTGVLMSCLNPWNADTILTRAYQHGLFRIIGGNSWSSDIDISRQLGTVTFAQLMSITRFRNRLKTLRQKTGQLLHIDHNPATIDQLLSNDTLTAKLASLIPDPCSENTGGYQSDLSRYLSLYSLRDSLEAGDLLGSSYMDIENPMDAFQPVIQLSISPQFTPYIYELLSQVESCCDLLCEHVKSRVPIRRRPFEVFNTAPFTLEDPADLIQVSSYPSVHASKGLATALTLVMIAPERRDTLLQAGYQYGLNRVICGTNWHSDVEAGRIIGCLAVSLLASGSDFIELLDNARQEYITIKDAIITDNPSIQSDTTPDEQPLFTIDGRRATPHSRGVLIGPGKKIIKP
jgi:acid phosphatase (class A)